MKNMIAVMMMVAALGVCLLTGCSPTQKVFATSGGLDAPAEALGKLEVEVDVPRVSFRCVGEWIVFNSCTDAGRGDYLKGLLDEKLVKTAKERYGAEAVINVQYWPDLGMAKFPGGKVYAKGDMVRYKRFAS